MGGSRLWTLAWVLCAHAAALFLFTTGFFLTRFEVPDLSQCDVLPTDDDRAAQSTHLRRHDELHQGDNDGVAQSGCWMPRRYKRVVFVVIDALRYDFVTSTATPMSAQGSTAPSFYLNHLPVFSDMLARRPNNSLLLKFVADPPTMTMQRLKGLTTGSLPTFLDIKDNMASTEIAEDNLVRQMREQQRKIVFMGDDTWDGLYAQHFTRKYSYDSFNVKDLDTVDNGVVRHLFPELKQKDWGLLIAHFLGVDHVGHTHGPSSPFMTKKLHEMNSVMERLLQEIDEDEDTLLAVMGDHGMSSDGNHGGATDDETGAALFLFSNKPLVETSGGDEEANVWPTEVPQVDLVPTLALLSGLPIPFGNLGSVIPQLFLHSDATTGSRMASLKTLNQALGLNVDQVRRYLFRYSKASKLPEREYDTLEAIFSQIAMLREKLQSQEPLQCTANQEAHVKLAHLQQAFLREALSLGRSIWTQFDFCNMGWGMLFLVWSLYLVVMNGVCGQHTQGYFPTQWSFTGAVIGFFIPAIHTVVPVLPAAAFSRALVVAVLFGLVDSTQRVSQFQFFNSVKKNNVAEAIAKTFDASNVVAFAVVLLHVLALLSNSYIVAEDRVMTFLSVTVGFFLLFQCQRSLANQPKTKVAAIASCLVLIASTRLAGTLDPPNIIQSDVSLQRTLVPLVATVVLAFATTTASTTTNPLASSSPLRVRCMFVSVITSCASCALYWLLSPIESTLVRLWLPRSVFLTALCGIAFHVQRGVSHPLRQDESPQIVRISISPEYVLTVFQVVPAFMLVLGPTSPLSVLCLVLQCLSFAAITRLCFTASNSSSKIKSSSMRSMPVSWVLLWSTLCYQSFFFTGHQNTFTNLQNAAGFVGFDDFHFYWAGALLGFNTFGCFLVWLFFLPFATAHDEQQQPQSSSGIEKTTHRRSVVTPAYYWRSAFAVVLHFALNATVSTAFVALQRRHLMVWAIFAPKFIFDAIALLVLELLLLLTSLQVLGL
ncbi:Gpi ethanolamine phosphate transferase 3 [Globisporangium polare]